MRWRSVSRTGSRCVAALALAVALARCAGGSGEQLPVLTSLRLAALSDQVVTGRNCGGPLVAAVVAAVNAGEVPPSLQEALVSDANRIAATCSRRGARKLAARLRP